MVHKCSHLRRRAHMHANSSHHSAYNFSLNTNCCNMSKMLFSRCKLCVTCSRFLYKSHNVTGNKYRFAQIVQETARIGYKFGRTLNKTFKHVIADSVSNDFYYYSESI